MRARFSVLLPYTLFVIRPHEMTPHQDRVYGIDAVFYPPCKAAAVVGQNAPYEIKSPVASQQQQPSSTITVDGVPPIEADLLQIDFHKESFDRQKREGRQLDPPKEILMFAANLWLGILRGVLQAPHLRPITDTQFWRLDYLNDDGTPLSDEPGLFRTFLSYQYVFKLSVLSPESWEDAKAVTKYPPIYFSLIMDAEAVLPEVGSAIMLAYMALETLIDTSLDHLAIAKGVPKNLWSWIMDRGNWLKDPSTEEQFTTLLEILTGKSLKQEPMLWRAFGTLRRARNTFAHTGETELDGKQLMSNEALRLIQSTKDIIKWIEALLPTERRFVSAAKTYNVQATTPPIPLI